MRLHVPAREEGVTGEIKKKFNDITTWGEGTVGCFVFSFTLNCIIQYLLDYFISSIEVSMMRECACHAEQGEETREGGVCQLT